MTTRTISETSKLPLLPREIIDYHIVKYITIDNHDLETIYRTLIALYSNRSSECHYHLVSKYSKILKNFRSYYPRLQHLMRIITDRRIDNLYYVHLECGYESKYEKHEIINLLTGTIWCIGIITINQYSITETINKESYIERELGYKLAEIVKTTNSKTYNNILQSSGWKRMSQ